jgi:hypothetical protein
MGTVRGAVNNIPQQHRQLQRQQLRLGHKRSNVQQEQHVSAAAQCSMQPQHQQLRKPSKQLPQLLLALLLLLLLPSPSAAQQPMPFQGQGDDAPAVPTEVHVSLFLDRLLNVDDRSYEFQV